jgi:lipocalin
MRYEDFFQLDGDCGTATYKLQDDGIIEVTNAHYWFHNSTFKDAVGSAELSFPDAKPISGQFSVRFSPRRMTIDSILLLLFDYNISRATF